MFNTIKSKTKKWFLQSSENSLEEAYQAALRIKKMEDEHFNGEKISSKNGDYGASVLAYFQTELNSNLQIIKMKMMKFKTSRSFFNLFGNSANKLKNKNDYFSSEKLISQKAIILERLNFIDEITTKYKTNSNEIITKDSSANELIVNSKSTKNIKSNANDIKDNIHKNLETVSDKTNVLPRSFLRTLNRIKQEIDPQSTKSEENLVNKYRKTRYKTAISVKFLLLLIIVPLLVHNLSKIALGEIFIDPYFNSHEQIVFINNDLQEETFVELRNFEENLHFKTIIGLMPELSKEELEEKIKHKAEELAEESRQRSANAIKNIFADMISLIAFGGVIYYSKKEVAILKSFVDEIIYGLSDSAKAFLIILFTDMFVGFHSPHGWEVILEGIGNHFGIAENRDFNFLFIATFPVILDTVLKYWIFRYLNRISPSAVATYKNMNES